MDKRAIAAERPEAEKPGTPAVIWWVSQDECALILGYLSADLPEYIKVLLESLDGRPKRGRLWVTDGIDFEEIDHAHESFWLPFFTDRGGLVIHARDAALAISLPGYVTDLHAAPFKFATPGT